MSSRHLRCNNLQVSYYSIDFVTLGRLKKEFKILHRNQPPSFFKLTQISICEHNFAAAASTRSRTAAAQQQQLHETSNYFLPLLQFWKRKRFCWEKKNKFFEEKVSGKIFERRHENCPNEKSPNAKILPKKSRHKSYWNKNKFLKCIYSLGGWGI